MYLREVKNNIFKAFLTAGLSNRIRTLLALLYVCNKNNWKLHIYWPRTIICPSHFLSIFEPLDNISFIYVENKEDNWNFKGQYIFYGIILDYFPKMTIKQLKEIELTYYAKLKPKKFIMNAIEEFDRKYNLKKCYAMHIRRTDHVNLAKDEKKYTESIEFENYIEEAPTKVYLATDNKQTQDKFIKNYPNKIIYYKKITYNPNYRKTSIEHAVIDIYICSKAKYFKPSGASSFSDFINILRDINIMNDMKRIKNIKGGFDIIKYSYIDF